MPVFYLSDQIVFPPPHFAEKSGLLAVGGDLSQKRLLAAYRKGIFPWYSKGDPILWWSPDPRLVLYPETLKISKSLKKVIHKKQFHITFDQAFHQVIQNCAEVRTENRRETWLVPEMISAYLSLHKSGYAHSVEAWQDGELAGGLYGLALGKCFFGESMFSKQSNASKVAFFHLVNHLKALDFQIIDCQVTTRHLLSFGAIEIQRAEFLKELGKFLKAPTIKGPWRMAD
ncbi:MAG: leucyl/phenylalanyl-tRNA--protein transferase [Proteobacteria bacterium]|nr:leucyl/phenylalanyl-tRNA--protein transferase [Pseudomonadota bacterium]MBU4470171.1 leucyl/phenylalanyl-tRNA--protein transferase [Pseudomonadota bacterium]MCG2750464.1 leucyl/phenylalanyl-tRNA--protein transferase [Desulfobacteraceae bacterium]